MRGHPPKGQPDSSTQASLKFHSTSSEKRRTAAPLHNPQSSLAVHKHVNGPRRARENQGLQQGHQGFDLRAVRGLVLPRDAQGEVPRTSSIQDQAATEATALPSVATKSGPPEPSLASSISAISARYSSRESTMGAAGTSCTSMASSLFSSRLFGSSRPERSAASSEQHHNK